MDMEEEGQSVVNTRDSALRLDFSSNFKCDEAQLIDIKNIIIVNKHKKISDMNRIMET